MASRPLVGYFMFTDSHAHIEMPDFDNDRKEVIQRANQAGVTTILNIGSAEPGSDSLQKAIALADEYDFIYTTIGVHPHEAKSVTEDFYAELEQRSRHPKIVAWGEIGLDYYYDNSPRQVQKEVFRRQLRLARDANLPVIIHSREAEQDTLDILRQEWNQYSLGGIMHCFSASSEMAQECLRMGFLISFSGIITFKNAENLRQIAEWLSLDNMLIETDSPFLAPVPYRGKRNESAYVVEVAKTIASVKRMAIEDVAKATSANFVRLLLRK